MDEMTRLKAVLERWDCRIDGAEQRGGMSVVVPVRSRSGVPLMLKLLDPDAAAREAIALRAFPDDAAVRCHGHAADLGALLLERLTPVSLVGADPDELIMVQADLARRLAVPDPGGIDRLAETDGWLHQLDDLHRLGPDLLGARAIGSARETIARLGRDPITTTLTHGDLHAANVHRDAEGRWRVLDPSPWVGTIAFESHTVIVERPRLGELVAAGPVELGRRLELFAEVAGVDRESAVRLCQARAVSSALAERSRAPGLAAGLVWMAEALT